LEYNLVHAFLGRFGVLIPLLGLFFEMGGIISQKPAVSKIAGGLVILGCLVVVMAGFTGYLQYSYLMEAGQVSRQLKIHAFLGGFLSLFFGFLLTFRIYLFRHYCDRTVVLYFVLYTVAVLVNLFSNEIVVHTVRGGATG